MYQQTIYLQQQPPQQTILIIAIAITLLILIFVKSLYKFILVPTSTSIIDNYDKIIMLFMLFFNPITVHQLSNDALMLIKIQLICYYIFFISQDIYKKQIDIVQILLELSIIIFVNNFSALIIATNLFKIHPIYKSDNNKTVRIISFIIIKCMIYICLNIALYYTINSHYTLIHPKTFNIGINLMSLLYSHTFSRYLYLYQIFMCFIPYLVIIPLMSVGVCNQFKLTLCYFFCLYCASDLSIEGQAMPIFLLYILEIWSYHFMVDNFETRIQEIQEETTKVQAHILTLNVIGMAASIVSIVGYFTFRHFYWLYNNTHAAGITYVHAGQLIFWISHVIYLAQALTVHNGQDDKKSFTLKSWIKTKIEQI